MCGITCCPDCLLVWSNVCVLFHCCPICLVVNNDVCVLFYCCPDCLKVLIVCVCHVCHCLYWSESLLMWNNICLLFYCCPDCLKVLIVLACIFGTGFTVWLSPGVKLYIFVVLLVSRLSQGIDSISLSFLVLCSLFWLSASMKLYLFVVLLVSWLS